MHPSTSPDGPTVLAPSTAERALVWLGFPLVGAVLGALLGPFATWVVALPWAPLQGPFELVTSIPEPYLTVGGPVVGVLAGLGVALLASAESVTVTVDAAEVTVTRDDSTRRVSRDAVHAVFLDRKELVFLGEDSREIAREGGDLPSRDQLAAALGGHGYPWAEEDPHRDAYRRWVPGDPDLSAGEHALLAARGKAVERDDATDTTELRAELARHGVVVRDEDKRQYWRRGGSPDQG